MTRQYEDTETRRGQVARAALQVIAEDGIPSFTTRAIAARVGISDGSLFRHFGNKEEIVLEAMGLLEVEIEKGLISTGDDLADLEGFFRHRAAFVGSESSVGRLIFSDGLIHLAGDAGRQRIGAWRKRSVDYLLERLGRLKVAGRVRGDADIQTLSVLIQGALLTFAMQASLGQGGSKEELEARIDHLWGGMSTLLFC